MVRSILLGAAAMVAMGGAAQTAHALVVTQSTDSGVLTGALVANPAQFDSFGASYTQGNPGQVGTYTGFTSPPVTIGNGIVMSTGTAVQVVAPADPSISAPVNPTTDFGNGSTSQIDLYAPGHIQNWSGSHDAAVLTVNFRLATPQAVAFDFIFGSVEYPGYTSQYTDAVFGFLDGNQIIFDKNGQAVQVGNSFASQLTTGDTNTAFAAPHGLLRTLTTTSGTLSATDHTLLLEIADTNDGILDSGIFISNFRTTTNSGGPTTDPEDLPEPASLAIFATSALLLGFLRRR